MIMEILTGNGGDSVLFARSTGGILSSSTKKSGGDSVRGGFCPTLNLRLCFGIGKICFSHDVAQYEIKRRKQRNK